MPSDVWFNQDPKYNISQEKEFIGQATLCLLSKSSGNMKEVKLEESL